MSRFVHRLAHGTLALAIGLPGTTALCNTITVDTAADPGLAGECSLRAAITAANSNMASQNCSAGGGASDTIQFNISPSGVKTISLQAMTPLPAITAPVVINGYTQPGATANSLAGASNAVPGIILNGTNSGGIGVSISASGGGSTIRGLVIQNFADGGILLDASSSNTIQGNFIGTNGLGSSGAPNGTNNFAGGIRILADAAGEVANSNVIGSATAADRNLISGNFGPGISVYAFSGGNISGTTIAGNLIGGNRAGTTAVAATVLHNNGRGIAIAGATGTTIGSTTGTTPGAACSGGCNLISGNFGQVEMGSMETAQGTLIIANHIGTTAAGTAAMPTSLGNTLSGISISSANGSTMTIGGTSAAERNVISGQTGNGIDVQNFNGTLIPTIRGNYIGTNSAGTAAIQNGQNGIHIQNTTGVIIGGTAAGAGNLISGNRYHGINLEGGAATLIQGNRIGTQADGVSPLGNGRRGIYAFHSGFVSPDDNVIGAQSGQSTGGNTIAFNGQEDVGSSGVMLGGGVGNRVSRNSIHSNKNINDGAGIGIDIHGDGPSANDGCDFDAGVNNLQNNPTHLTVGGGGTTVSGRFQSTPSTQFTLEFYASPAEPFPDSVLEGKLFVGATTVNTSVAPNCLATFSNVALTTPVPVGQTLTAIAIAANGDTSEFTWVPDNLFSNGFE